MPSLVVGSRILKINIVSFCVIRVKKLKPHKMGEFLRLRGSPVKLLFHFIGQALPSL